jgi:FixJ family two-component response regulator
MSERPLIHVVDDDDSLREALLRLLDAAGFEVRGYASAGEFLLAPPPDRHGCLLLDVRMPGPSGLDLQAALQRLSIGLPVVFLSGQSDVGAGVRAMKSGAVDFLSKPVEREALLDAVGRALERDRAARAEREEEARLRESFASLTARELEVFGMLVQGRLNKQIGGTLGIAERTVKAHRASLMAKLGAGSPAELGVLAERLRRLAEGATAES